MERTIVRETRREGGPGVQVRVRCRHCEECCPPLLPPCGVQGGVKVRGTVLRTAGAVMLESWNV
jgi:hypothetical protein